MKAATIEGDRFRRCAPYRQPPATFTAWEDLPLDADMRFYEELRGAVTPHDLQALFDRLIAGDSLPGKKPVPAGVLACLEHGGLRPEEARSVGDSFPHAAKICNARVACCCPVLTTWVKPSPTARPTG